MRYIRTYKKYKTVQPGDYFIANVSHYNIFANNYLNSLVYKVYRFIQNDTYSAFINLDELDPSYKQYFNKYKLTNKAFRYFQTKEIKDVFKTKEEAQLALNIKKFNI